MWQAVTAALPTWGQRVLVYTHGGNLELATYSGLGALGYPMWAMAHESAVSRYQDTITHWHPLPEPPQ